MSEIMEIEVQFIAKQAIANAKGLADEIKKMQTQISKPDSGQMSESISRLQAELKKTQTSMKLFGTTSEDLKKQATQIKETVVNLVEKGLEPESEAVQNLIKDYKNLETQSKTLDKSTGDVFSSFGDLQSAITQTGVALAAVKLDKEIIGLGNFAIEAADSFQTARNDFGIMLQDMEAGAAVFDQIIKPFNDFTPFNLDTTQQAAKALMSAKVHTKDLTTWLTRMGDMSQGNSQRMTSYVSAFSKASAKGKADMEVLNVYIDQGVPILDELGKHFGKTSEEIVKMVSDGKVSFDDFKQTLEAMTDAGGQYYGGMELASRSYAAMQEGAKEANKSLASSYGDILLPAAIKTLEVYTKIINAINDSPFVKGILAAALVAIAGYLNAMAIKAGIAFVKQMSLNLAVGALNPAVMAATVAVGALVGGLTIWASHNQEVEATNNANALATKQADQAAQSYLDTIRQMSNVELAPLKQEISLDLSALRYELLAAEAALANMPKMTTDMNGLYNPLGIEHVSEAYVNQEKKVESLRAKIEQLNEQIAAANATEMLNNINSELANGNDLLKWRNDLYGKTTAGQLEALQEQLKTAKELYTLQTRNEDGTYSGFNVAKTDAIVAYIEGQIESLIKKAESIGTTWQDKLLIGIEAIDNEWKKSLDDLNSKAIKNLGSEFATNVDYINELDSLNIYYAQKLEDYKRTAAEKTAEAERKRIIEEHQARLDAYREEAEYQRELARQNLEMSQSNGSFKDQVSAYGSYAGASIKVAIADTNLGELFANIENGMSGLNSIVTQLIDSLIVGILQIESVSKTLNFIDTIVGSLIETIEPIIDEIFNPFVELLEDIGTMLGTFIAPILGLIAPVAKVLVGALRILLEPVQILANVFEWLYNSIIVPVGNGIINVMNAVIDALNKIPFVNIKKLDNLSLIGQKAEEMAAEIERQTEKIKAMYERQKDRVNDLLSAQIDSLKSQYELGLITREQYNIEAEKYQSTADEELLKINETMAIALAQIESNTYAALSSNQQAQVAESRKNYAQQLGESWGDNAGVFGEIAGTIIGTVADVGVAIWDGITSAAGTVSDWFDSWWPFANGTPNIPCDMPAIVHKGEGIIPATFNQGIQRGDYALVGKNSQNANSNGNQVYVTINVGGPVVTERQLIDVVYDGLSRVIGSREKAPLPQGA